MKITVELHTIRMMKTAEVGPRIIIAANILNQEVTVDATWPKSGKDDAWPTKTVTDQCKGCLHFIPKQNCEGIRQVLEDDPEAPEGFNFGDNYSGICLLRTITVFNSRSARNTPSVLFPSRAGYKKCQALSRSKFTS